jgi:glycosyltransferase involved in cell wall biosynthesis
LTNILFLTLSSFDSVYQRGIYTDLARSIAKRGCNVFVVAPRQRRVGLPTELASPDDNLHVLHVRTGNITKVGLIEKGISTLAIQKEYRRAIEKHFGGIRFHMIIYSTPPITFEKLVEKLKEKHQAKTYLILKDIFPQNAVDLGIIRYNSMLWQYFRRRERNLYVLSDFIGCMSPANVKYILDHNSDVDAQKVEVFPNAIEPRPCIVRRKDNRLLAKYGVPIGSVLFVYGGNLGKPQGVDFLLEVADNFYQVDNAFLMIVGSGTEYGRIEKHVQATKPKNVGIFRQLPKEEYDALLESADVGLIFLDRRFTIPNFPSRLTSYMESSLPVLAATDVNTDLKDVLQESQCGFWVESGDLKGFLDHARRLALNAKLRMQMGARGRAYLEEHYDVTKAVDIILKHL